jgi:hypothetical protein
MARDPSSVAIMIGDRVVISCPCSGEDHEGGYHELSAGCTGRVDSIDTYKGEQGLAFTVCIPVDEDRNIVNVFDELDGPIEQFLRVI